MGLEIERKFLVTGDVPTTGDGAKITQAYLCLDPERTIRVRVEDDSATITIKGRSTGISRAEFEYEVPLADGLEMLNMATGDPIEKRRYRIDAPPFVWEIDVFEGANEGLVIAEIELESESDSFDVPEWLGPEVSDDSRYLNACLSQAPFTTW